MSEPFNRRVNDPRIQRILEQSEESHRTHIRTRGLIDDVLWLRGENAKVQAKLEANTMKIDVLIDVTSQVRDILTTFKVTNAIAKWIAAIGAACAAIYYGWHNIK